MAKTREAKFRTVSVGRWSGRTSKGAISGPEYRCWHCAWFLRLAPESTQGKGYKAMDPNGKRRPLTDAEKSAIETKSCPECGGGTLRSRSEVRGRQRQAAILADILKDVPREEQAKTFGLSAREMRQVLSGCIPPPSGFHQRAADLRVACLSREEKFIDAVAAGRAQVDQIDQYIEKWKARGGDKVCPAHEFLGLTVEEYDEWAKDPAALEDAAARRS